VEQASEGGTIGLEIAQVAARVSCRTGLNSHQMSSMQPIDENFALRSKIAELEMKQKMQRVAQKTELMKIQAALENENRYRLLEKKIEKRDRDQVL
jgi:arginyl-tRNA--protein-N-Asp/Glu arginylyltransferase